MSTNQARVLRIYVMILLALLFVQYEFGMAVNISNPPSLPSFSIGDGNAFNAALNAAGGLAQPHAILGFLIWLIAVVNLVLSLRTRVRGVQVFGLLTFLGITVAGIGGTLFVSSGFNNDTASHAMAANFIFSYSFAFLELYFLKGNAGSAREVSQER